MCIVTVSVMRIVSIIVMTCMCTMTFFFMMLASRCATRRTKEGEVRCARHVRSSHECTDKSNNHEHLVTVIANVVDDFVF